MLTSRCNQFEDTFENTCFFFIGQVSMGTHTLSGTRDYGILQHRRDCVYVHDFQVLPGDWNSFYTVIVKRVHWGFSCCFFHLFVLLLWSRHVARLWQGRHLGGGPVPQVLADLGRDLPRMGRYLDVLLSCSLIVLFSYCFVLLFRVVFCIVIFCESSSSDLPLYWLVIVLLPHLFLV